MAKLIIYMGDPEREALHQLARHELRTPRAQAALIIRTELSRLGLLSEPSPSADSTTGEGCAQEVRP